MPPRRRRLRYRRRGADKHVGADGPHNVPEILAGLGRRAVERSEQLARLGVKQIDSTGRGGKIAILIRADKNVVAQRRHREAKLVVHRVRRRVVEGSQKLPGLAVKQVDGPGKVPSIAVSIGTDEKVVPHDCNAGTEEIACGAGRRIVDLEEQLAGLAVEHVGGPRIGTEAVVRVCPDDHFVADGRHRDPKALRLRPLKRPEQVSAGAVEQIDGPRARCSDENVIPQCGHRTAEMGLGCRMRIRQFTGQFPLGLDTPKLHRPPVQSRLVGVPHSVSIQVVEYGAANLGMVMLHRPDVVNRRSAAIAVLRSRDVALIGAQRRIPRVNRRTARQEIVRRGCPAVVLEWPEQRIDRAALGADLIAACSGGEVLAAAGEA